MGISTRMIQELWINIRGRMTKESWFMASYLEISKVYMWLGRMIKDLWINIRGGMTKESWLMIYHLLLRIYREEEYNWEIIRWCRSCESKLEIGWLRNCDSCGLYSWVGACLLSQLNLLNSIKECSRHARTERWARYELSPCPGWKGKLAVTALSTNIREQVHPNLMKKNSKRKRGNMCSDR